MASSPTLLLLGGAGQRNYIWLKQLQIALRYICIDSDIFPYTHWETGDDINIDLEVKKLTSRLQRNQPVIIIAKSAGSLVTISANKQLASIIHKVVIIGFPLAFAKENDIDLTKLTRNYTTSTLCIQARQDPFGNFDDVERFFASFPNILMAKVRGTDHTYADIETITNLIKDFLYQL